MYTRYVLWCAITGSGSGMAGYHGCTGFKGEKWLRLDFNLRVCYAIASLSSFS